MNGYSGMDEDRGPVFVVRKLKCILSLGMRRFELEFFFFLEEYPPDRERVSLMNFPYN